MPTKVFTVDEILTAADVNNYLANRPLQNAIINGGFDIWQRGTSGFNLGGSYNADRWLFYTGTATNKSVTRQPFTAGELSVASFGDANFYWRYAETVATVSDTNVLVQRIEDVRTLTNQTVTLSFYARSSNVASTISPSLSQNFGTGGSSEVIIAGSSQILTSSFVRYSQTFTLASVSGKTIGANSYLQASLAIGTNRVQNVDIWGVQLEAGSVANDFRRNANSLQGELAACQRYYEKSYNLTVAPGTNTTDGLATFYGSTDGSSNIVCRVPFAVNKRTVAYTLTVYTAAGTSGFITVSRSGYSANNAAVAYRFGHGAFHAYATTLNSFVSANAEFQYTVSDEL